MRTWPLTLTVAAIVLLSVVVDALGFLRFAAAIGLPEWTAILVLPIKALEWLFLGFARDLWAGRWLGKLSSCAMFIVWCMAVALSALAGNATIFTLLASADHSAAKKVETRANVKVSLAGIEAQLASLSKLGVPRPVRTVQEALDWMALPQAIRHATLDCGRIEEDYHRKACKEALATDELTRFQVAITLLLAITWGAANRCRIGAVVLPLRAFGARPQWRAGAVVAVRGRTT